jgi:hypothetical protein
MRNDHRPHQGVSRATTSDREHKIAANRSPYVPDGPAEDPSVAPSSGQRRRRAGMGRRRLHRAAGHLGEDRSGTDHPDRQAQRCRHRVRRAAPPLGGRADVRLAHQTPPLCPRLRDLPRPAPKPWSTSPPSTPSPDDLPAPPISTPGFSVSNALLVDVRLDARSGSSRPTMSVRPRHLQHSRRRTRLPIGVRKRAAVD